MKEVVIRECTSLEEMHKCVELQREVFGLPDIEISPVRHLVVTRNAGGWSLGAFVDERLVGFVLNVPGFKGGERFFYSHMTAVAKDVQGLGIGAKLKWAQRKRALAEGVNFIKWTFQPVQARNAFFNLERLGAIVKSYSPNFYGTDYPLAPGALTGVGVDSDRLIAEWDLQSEKVFAIERGEAYVEGRELVAEINIPPDWDSLLRSDPAAAANEQARIKAEFESAFAEGAVARGFMRSESAPRYLLYRG